MKKISLLAVLLLFLLLTQFAEAKVLPQAKKSQVTTKSTGTGTTINVAPRLRGDRRALMVNFSNLQNATQVSYLLRYKTNGQEEGAMGALNLSGKSQTSELLFGTCSKNICRYHTNITDAKLDVSYTSKSGKKYLKKYKIKA